MSLNSAIYVQTKQYIDVFNLSYDLSLTLCDYVVPGTVLVGTESDVSNNAVYGR